MPRKGYKTLTIKDATFKRFQKKKKRLQKDGTVVKNSNLLDLLLDGWS